MTAVIIFVDDLHPRKWARIALLLKDDIKLEKLDCKIG